MRQARLALTRIAFVVARHAAPCASKATARAYMAEPRALRLSLRRSLHEYQDNPQFRSLDPLMFERRSFSAQSIDRVTLASDRSKLDIRLLSLEDSLISILQTVKHAAVAS
jgi:hypothetical protein